MSLQNCSRCHVTFESPLTSRYCPLCRDPARRVAMSCDCQGTHWVCRAHTNLALEQCDCRAGLVPCHCNPNMRFPHGWYVVEGVRL